METQQYKVCSTVIDSLVSTVIYALKKKVILCFELFNIGFSVANTNNLQ